MFIIQSILIFIPIICINAIPIKYTEFPGTDHFFSYGSGAGDEILVNQFDDDFHSDEAHFNRTVSAHYPFLDLENNDKIQLSVNGYIAFGDNPIVQYIPDHPYPFYYDKSNEIAAPQLNPWYTDLMFNTATKEYYKSCFSWQEHHYGSYVLEDATYQIHEKFKRNKFYASRAIVVTWKMSGHYGEENEKTVTFQAALVTDEYDTYVFFNFATEHFDVEYFHPTAIGWQGKNPSLFYEHRLSQFYYDDSKSDNQTSILMSEQSNVGEPGKWIYRVYKHVNPSEYVPDESVNEAQCPADLEVEVAHYCHYIPAGKYTHPYYNPYNHHYYSNYFIECAPNDKTTHCKTCASKTLYYSEKCDQCLYGPPKDRYDEVCYEPPTTTTTTTLTPTAGPCAECNDEAAKAFCTTRPLRGDGAYAVFDDSTFTYYYLCYFGWYPAFATGIIRKCAPGSHFCILDSTRNTGGCR